MNQHDRRSFLKLSTGLVAAGGLGGLLSACGSRESKAVAGQAPFGLQLYTLRDVLPQDPQGVLRQVASFGYHQIESYEGAQGIFWGMGRAGFKTFVEDLGMTALSSHVGNFNDFDSFAKKAEDAAAIGMEYLICPYAKRESLDQYRALADDFNRAGEIAKAAGIRFAYHNHAYSFEQVDGIYPQDLFLDRSDPELVDFEMDIYWVVAAKQDPAAWLKKSPGRYTLSHVKDLRRDGDSQESTTLGQGVIDWATLLPLGRSLGMKHFIVEQEQYTGTTPLESTEDNAAYLASLAF